jgi:hypothetical protein
MARLPFVPTFIVSTALGLIVGPLACATAVTTPPDDDDGGGGSTTTTATSTTAGSGTGGGGGAGAGPAGPCSTAADCIAFSDSCNLGTCINGTCEKSPTGDGAACDDGKECSIGDSCQGGECLGSSQKFCPATTTCMIGSCDLVTDSCIEVPGNDGAGCIDDDPCTLTGSCNGGVCAPGQSVDCSFLNSPCGIGVCDSQIGCVAQPQNDGTPCDDALFCTINDVCGGGMCGGVPNTCAAPGDVCLIGSCDEFQDTCVAVPGNNGASCNDNSTCTVNETCSNGMCGGGAPTNQGGACNDASACTTGDTCQNGVCSGAAVVACVNSDGCCPAACSSVNDNDCGCINNPQWMPVSCITTDWVWSRNKAIATTLAAANANDVLATGCTHGSPQPQLSQGLCSLDGTGWVSTQTFPMVGCDASWYHIGGNYTGDCGGHDGDTWRHLVLGPNDCYAY